MDIGTNSTRLLVHDGVTEFDRRSTITRLGEGVDAERRLRTEAMERTAEVLAQYRTVCDELAVDKIRIIATSASRDAANREEFFDLVETRCGIRPEVVSGTVEASLAFSGATASTAAAASNTDPTLVIDIGGGSTEFILGDRNGVLGSISIDVGSVRLTERELHRDPPRPEELTNAIGWVSDHFEEVEQAIVDIRSARSVVGVAGTITTVAAVELGLIDYDRDRIHGFVLTRAAAEEVFRTLATESLADRVHNPGLPRARADIIVGGCCILVAIMRWLHLDHLVVSESDLLDGTVIELLAQG
jgi:exopolyphosphatase/guanosine-5'-triphosphate,3'-diphosphate pyrophosphatase